MLLSLKAKDFHNLLTPRRAQDGGPRLSGGRRRARIVNEAILGPMEGDARATAGPLALVPQNTDTGITA